MVMVCGVMISQDAQNFPTFFSASAASARTVLSGLRVASTRSGIAACADGPNLANAEHAYHLTVRSLSSRNRVASAGTDKAGIAAKSPMVLAALQRTAGSGSSSARTRAGKTTVACSGNFSNVAAAPNLISGCPVPKASMSGWTDASPITRKTEQQHLDFRSLRRVVTESERGESAASHTDPRSLISSGIAGVAAGPRSTCRRPLAPRQCRIEQ